MKKIIFTITMIFMAIATTQAKVDMNSIEDEINKTGEYINKMGVKIDLNNFNKIKNHFTASAIEEITPTYYKYIKKSTGIANSITKYFETYTFINAIGEEFTTTKEITQEEYESNNLINARASTHNTTMKEISIRQTKADVTVISIETSWKSTPQNLSYDVTAIRTSKNINITDLEAEQPHIKNGSWQYINYEYNSSNFKTFSKGVGLSLNLVDGAESHKALMFLETPCQQYMKVYGTYQHAQGTVTLAQSQDYTLIGGTVDEGVFGNVIQFNNLTTRSIYDKTAGVDLTLTCS